MNKQTVLDWIKQASMMEISELVKDIEKEFGVTAAAGVAMMAGPATGAGAGAGAPVVEEKTEFEVVLTAVGEKKINVIKVVREITSLGLKEAKDLVEAVPKVVKESVSKDEAETIKKKFAEVGATIEIK
ncbi:MAG: 50S ribosomal protein L7/L12 [Acidobacteria bacterium]|nr:50S ribosomal protein L7/L12 [Acidobacteriota bacterium]MBI3655190.1 50S ribosomal protein L7/L12 [Acidobacteriota bacterium]